MEFEWDIVLCTMSGMMTANLCLTLSIDPGRWNNCMEADEVNTLSSRKLLLVVTLSSYLFCASEESFYLPEHKFSLAVWNRNPIGLYF